MPLYESPDGFVETLEWGEGDHSMILLHAAGAGPHSLSELAKALVTPGWHIVAPALHGYGKTEMHHDDLIRCHLAVANRVCDQFFKASARRAIFGHSMGGLIALQAAALRGDCHAVMAYDPICPAVLRPTDALDAGPLTWDRDIVADLADAVTQGEPERGVRRFIEAWNGTDWDALPGSVRDGLVARAQSLADESTAVSYWQPDGLEKLRGQCAVTLFNGTLSPPVTTRMATRLLELVATGNRIDIAGAGHMCPVTAGGRFAERVLARVAAN